MKNKELLMKEFVKKQLTKENIEYFCELVGDAKHAHFHEYLVSLKEETIFDMSQSVERFRAQEAAKRELTAKENTAYKNFMLHFAMAIEAKNKVQERDR